MNTTVHIAVIILSILVLGQAIWHVISKRRLLHQIDQAEELLTAIIERSAGRNATEEEWNNWKDICEKYYTQNSMGRLYGRIWEIAQIYRERESGNRREQNYLKDLMQDISHQIKTPLAALTVFIDIFTKHLDEQNKKELELAETAKWQIERMRWLINGMLKLAQVESGALQYEYEELPIRETIDRCISALQLKWKEKKLQIKVEENVEHEIIFRQDINWLQEAYQNLLKNSIEYAPDGSKIYILIEETSLGVTVSIQDQGEGIPEQEIPKIFNRFYRVHKDGQKADGVGIGLALSKSIIEAQGGILTAYSQTGEASYTKFVSTFLTKM